MSKCKYRLGALLSRTANYGNTHWGTHCSGITICLLMSCRPQRPSFCFYYFIQKNKQNKTHKPVLAILVTEKRKETQNSYLRADLKRTEWLDWLAHIYGIFTYGIYTYGAKTWTSSHFSQGSSPPSISPCQEGRGQQASQQGWEGRKDWHWANCKGVWSTLREGLGWLRNSRHCKCRTSRCGRSRSLVLEVRKWALCDGPGAASVNRQGSRRERKFCIGGVGVGSGHRWACHVPLLSAVRQSLRFKCEHSPLTLKGKKKPKPTGPTGARGVPRRSLYNFQGRESFQRSEGTYGRDRAPRLPARAGTSLCPLPLTALSPILDLHEAFLGEGRKSQLRSLHKNSLMESSRDNRR